MKKCLVIATTAEGGWYNDTSKFHPDSSEVYDTLLVNFDPSGFVFQPSSAEWYHEDVGYKHHIYKRLIEGRKILDRYDWIWMPDYDVQLEPDEIERLFKIAEDYNLNICQPSLTRTSYHSFPIVLNDPSKFMRYTNYVEIMCPLFKSDALRRVLWTFTLTYSGWAQDFVWARDLGYERLAIVDDVQAAHVKPVESQHWKLPNGLNADQELDMTVRLLGLQKETFWPRVIGGIERWT